MNTIVNILLLLLISILLHEQIAPTPVFAANMVSKLPYNSNNDLQQYLKQSKNKVVNGFNIQVDDVKVIVYSGVVSYNTTRVVVPGKTLLLPSKNDNMSGIARRYFYLYAKGNVLELSSKLDSSVAFTPIYLFVFDSNSHLTTFDLRRLYHINQTVDVTVIGGGKFDGADETTSIEAALIISRYLGGCNILIPNGNYIVHGNIKIPNNTVITFGESARILLADNAKCDFIIGGDSVDNVRIIGGVFDAKSSESKKYISAIYSWNGCKNWTFENCKIINSNGHGIFMNSASEITFNNITIENVAGIGIGIFNTTGNITIKNSIIINAAKNGIEISGGAASNFCVNLLLTDSRINGASGNNLALSYISNSKISNSHFINSTKHAGLSCKACQYLDINNNVFSGNWDGILLNYGSSFNNISNNVMKNNEQDGIDIAFNNGHNNKIANNTFIRNGVWGLYLFNANNNYISDNTFQDNGTKAESHNTHSAEIQIDNDSSGNTISNNKFISKLKYKTKYSIYSTKSSTEVNHITNNIFDGEFR